MKGKAYIVGAGPGRADLISVRGLALLRAADVVIYDRLIAQELLDEVHPQAERIFAGKRGYAPRVMTQEGINALLVERVQAGLRVVRLKGGDGFVFGRGGEECLALVAAGLDYEVVPGISSAIAAPAYAGIPVTHRSQASAFTVVAGYEDPAKEESHIDWSLMAKVPTLVVLMAVRPAEKICKTLVEHGRDPDSPAAAIASASTVHQKVARSTVAGLARAIELAEIRAPAVLVFGDVVAFGDQLAWFNPLEGGQGFVPPDSSKP
ncbi:MAG: uroporphyrinogen-III C-methyltransferase [Caldilineaceae bacterium]|uniref:uroporphyrinogen-III C-methyltransferase n=1 Tax=Caldilineaceae bacterium SB0675_bin_29 TaxID=2605266 RepID=A0A6B1FWK3_9CHLR|nr:uroporphyrinogen-III C-methyltransferase [Caldilineaceae bacterium]MYH60999.1 uroporphyrinogen-III C-methyltransferase [Caldilineaceae bacterium SB0675_bin_29]